MAENACVKFALDRLEADIAREDPKALARTHAILRECRRYGGKTTPEQRARFRRLFDEAADLSDPLDMQELSEIAAGIVGGPSGPVILRALQDTKREIRNPGSAPDSVFAEIKTAAKWGVVAAVVIGIAGIAVRVFG